VEHTPIKALPRKIIALEIGPSNTINNVEAKI